ncbi:MAG: glycoside-pentoside-hexuronide (GPH):cation symporter [Bacillota bacterium]
MGKKVDMNPNGSLSLQERTSYALGDVGCSLIFSLIAYLNVFYTDVVGLSATAVTVLFLVARLWDAVNDPLWGRLIDGMKPSKRGKYRKWLIYISPFTVMATLLLFAKFDSFTQTEATIYAACTYILWGMLYTGISIPYGSMASVMTSNNQERSNLSIFRSIGSGIGGIPVSLLFPVFCFTTVSIAGQSVSQIDYSSFYIGVIIVAVLCVGFLFVCYKGTHERVKQVTVASSETPVKENLMKIKQLLTNRPLVALSFGALFLTATQMFMQAYYVYLFKDFFGQAWLNTIFTVCLYAPMAILLPVISKVVKKYGKKHICAYGALLSFIVMLIITFVKTDSAIVFLIFAFLNGLGLTFFVLEMWAMVGDTIDYHQIKTGNREDATTFAFFSFIRKLGQTAAGVISIQALVWVNYDASLDIQTPETLADMYTISTLVPALLMLGMFVCLMFGYTLNKKKVEEINKQLALQADKAEIEEEITADKD